MEKYFFVLGTNKNLSLAELIALFGDNFNVCDAVAVSRSSSSKLWPDSSIDFEKLIASLGGTIKIGEIIKEISFANRHSLSDTVKKEIITSASKALSVKKDNQGKFNFGFSFYNKKKIPGDFFKLGLAIKKDLKNLGITSRMVVSKDQALSSVVVEQNKLIKNGLEICFLVENNKVLIGKTLAVQPFKDLSARDFGRPKRDDHSGMIPPKLAQIMINLARRDDNYKNKVLLDPFCGSGTILMEAYLMGFNKIVGSDLSDKAIVDSQENMNWIFNFKKDDKIESNIKIFQADVLSLDKSLSEGSIDYIVCEPYLGPQRGYQKFDEVVKELNTFYSQTIEKFFTILKPGGRVVMIWPKFRANNKIWELNPDIFKFNFKPTLDLSSSAIKNHNNRKTIIYGRENQKVWREIVVLEKNK